MTAVVAAFAFATILYWGYRASVHVLEADRRGRELGWWK